jgi:hypothetical protein
VALVELGDNAEVIVLEDIHELVFAVSKVGLRTEDRHDSGGLLGSSLGVRANLSNLSLNPESVDQVWRDDIFIDVGTRFRP